MDSQRIAEIKAREQAATPGPWRYSDVACEIWNEDGDTVVGGVDSEEVSISDTDTAFIAHARTDIPALLAEVERLAAENDQNAAYSNIYKDICDKYGENFRALLEKAKALQSKNAMLERALRLSIENHSTNHGMVERLISYYIQQAEREASNE